MTDADEAGPNGPGAQETVTKEPHELTEREAWEWIKGEFRGWSVADRRLLWITIIGGLAVNIVTILIVGLAVAWARSPREPWLLTGVMPVVLILFLPVLFWGDRNRKARRKIVLPLLVVVVGLTVTVVLLALIGKAAGIK
jgi:hypothetical protein